MILSMIDWVEGSGKKPAQIIGAKYVNDDRNKGVQFERPLCPYPQEAKYVGGDANSAASFKCAL